MKKFKDYFEFFFILSFYYFSKFIGIYFSSFIGGLILYTYGFFSKKSDLAFKNIKRVFPEYSQTRIKSTIRKMWFHFGRVLGEYPHLRNIDIFNDKRITIVGINNLIEPLKKNKNCLFFSGHIGNWELTSHPLTKSGYSVHFIYRAPNNILVDKLLIKIRKNYGVGLIKKGSEGAKKCIKVLTCSKGNIGMLIDQKMNDGIKSKFFGYDVMTASAIAKFSLKYKCPIIPSVCTRTKGVKFIIKYLPQINYKKVSELETEENIINYLNKYIESWIKDNPDQWIWIHNRW